MLHSRQITLTAGGSSANPTKTSFLANQGVIARAWITFPPGCAGLVKVRILHGGHPFIPVDPNQYLRGDSYTYEIPAMYEITDVPELIIVEAWNEDDTYNHTIDVQLLIIEKAWGQPVGAYEGIIAALKSIFTRR